MTAPVLPPDTTDPNFKPPKENCRHPEAMLVETSMDVCDPDLPMTVCTRCGLAFPGETKAMLVA